MKYCNFFTVFGAFLFLNAQIVQSVNITIVKGKTSIPQTGFILNTYDSSNVQRSSNPITFGKPISVNPIQSTADNNSPYILVMTQDERNERIMATINNI